ncbi:MAG: glycoside hydrolase family 28 protein [Candidatus Acidiferrales bacterium]
MPAELTSFPSRRKFMQGLAAGAAALPSADLLARDVPTAKAPQGAAAASAGAAGAAGTANSGCIYNVTAFGAVGDGKMLNTAAIQAAIDACAKAGGGTVLVPPGVFLTGPLFLKSHIVFEVVAGATLLGSANFSDYPTIAGRWEGLDRTVFASLLTGMDLENVTIQGRGTLDGQGPVWWDAFHKTTALRRQMNLMEREPENPPGSPLAWPRARMINLYRSKNIVIRDLSIVNSPSWNIHPVDCENVLIDGVSIVNPKMSPNTDGIDPESCRNVRISNCYISTGDDCIVIKSGYKYIADHPFGVCEDIAVTNCVFGYGHAGVCIGSETAGGVRNVTSSNCVCDGTARGLYIKTARGRGNVIEDIRAVNWVMRNIEQEPVMVTLVYQGSGDPAKAMPVDATTPTVRNVYFSGVTARTSKRAIAIEGLAESPIQNVYLRDIVIESSATGADCTRASGVTFENVIVNADGGPSLSASDTRDLDVLRFRTNKANPGQPVIQLNGVQDAVVESCSAAPGNDVLVEVAGTENENVQLLRNRINPGGTPVSFAGGAAESVVTRRD